MMVDMIVYDLTQQAGDGCAGGRHSHGVVKRCRRLGGGGYRRQEIVAMGSRASSKKSSGRMAGKSIWVGSVPGGRAARVGKRG